jgi:hypothetical protein
MLFERSGIPFHDSGGETFSPLQVYFGGIACIDANATLETEITFIPHPVRSACAVCHARTISADKKAIFIPNSFHATWSK